MAIPTPEREPSKAVPVGSIAELVRDPVGRPSTRAKAFWAWNAAVGWGIVLLIEVGWAALANDWDRPWRLILFAVTVAIAIAHVAVMPPWRYRVHRWQITADAVFTRSGWFTQESRVAPIARIQTIDSRRGLLHRLFQLTTVTVTTASAAGALVIPALDDDVAREVVAALTELTQHTRGDAT